MTDRVYPSAKPTAANDGAKPSFPATKAQLYGANQPAYRPQPFNHHRRRRRSSCCTLCFWFILIILLLVLLIAVAGAAVYFIYRPHRPSFAITSLKLSYLKITPSSTLKSKFELNFTATNPNTKNVAFAYEPIAISVLSDDDGVNVGDGSVPSFEHGKMNTTEFQSSILSSDVALVGDSASKLKANLKNEKGISLRVNLETKVKAKMGGFKTPKVGIRVSCDGITATIPVAGKKPTTAATSDTKCKVDVKFKIWKWTVG